MLPKLANLRVLDSSGAGWIQVFHIYRGFKHRSASLGDFVKGSIKHIAFYPRYRRGKRYRPLRLGFRVRGLVTQVRYPNRFVDGTRITTFQNSTILLKRRGLFKTKTNPGLLIRNIKRRQYLAIFAGYI